jgi:hypothetical protein
MRNFTQLATQYANRLGSFNTDLDSVALNRSDHDDNVPSNPNSFPDFSRKNQHPFILLHGTTGAPHFAQSAPVLFERVGTSIFNIRFNRIDHNRCGGDFQ